MNKPMTKKESILRVFIKLGKAGLNAEEGFQYGTTCLHTDISSLEQHGITFNRSRETLKRAAGGTKNYVRYSLTEQGLEVAQQLIEKLAQNRSKSK